MSRKPPVMAQLDFGGDSFKMDSFDISDAGHQLQLRAFLFRDGALYKDGSSISGDITEHDLDLKSKHIVGRGASASVHHVVHLRTGQPLALKCIPITTKSHRDEIAAELSVLSKSFDHPNITRCFNAFWEPESHTINIIMEWMAYSLHDITKFMPLTESYIRSIAFQLLQATKFLHESHDVIHRDVKPSNVLVNSQGEVKLGDFGISKCVRTLHISNTYVGTQVFMAPERLEEGTYGCVSDVWSIGLTLLSAALGRDPWLRPEDKGQLNLFHMLQRIHAGTLPTFPETFSPDAHAFIALCLERDPAQRATCADLLEHSFFAGVTEQSSVAVVKELVTSLTALAKRIANPKGSGASM